MCCEALGNVSRPREEQLLPLVRWWIMFTTGEGWSGPQGRRRPCGKCVWAQGWTSEPGGGHGEEGGASRGEHALGGLRDQIHGAPPCTGEIHHPNLLPPPASLEGPLPPSVINHLEGKPSSLCPCGSVLHAFSMSDRGRRIEDAERHDLGRIHPPFDIMTWPAGKRTHSRRT